MPRGIDNSDLAKKTISFGDLLKWLVSFKKYVPFFKLNIDDLNRVKSYEYDSSFWTCHAFYGSIYKAYYGKDADWELCECLSFSKNHPDPETRGKAGEKVVFLLEHLPETLSSTKQCFKIKKCLTSLIESNLRAVLNAPFDPVAVSVICGLEVLKQRHQQNKEGVILQAEVELEARKYFQPALAFKENHLLSGVIKRRTEEYIDALSLKNRFSY